MKISFLSPFPNLSGGARVIAIYAQRLAQRGHDVEVVCFRPRTPSRYSKLKRLLKGRGRFPQQDLSNSHHHYCDVNYRVVDHDGPLTGEDVRSGDVVIATWWETAAWAHRLPERCGAPVYFVQHHEVHPHLPQDLTRESYRFPLPKICVSEWLRETMRTEYKDHSAITVANSVDLSHFNSPPRAKGERLKIGMMWSDTGFKGSDIALKAVKLARESVSLELIAFGGRRPSPVPSDFDQIDEFFVSPAQDAIPGIYAACDAWLFSSRDEGFGLPILEAMACRTPVIGTPAGAAPELLERGGGILVKPEDPVDMAEATARIASMDGEDWRAMSDLAYATANSYTWDDATNLFESALTAVVDGTWDANRRFGDSRFVEAVGD